MSKSFAPMTAKNTAIKDLRLPVMISNKLEGVRGEFTPEGLKTRPFKKFNNKNLELFFAEVSLYCKKHKVYLEGEFYKHGMVFSDISSICRRGNHPDTDQLEFHVFDFYAEHMSDMKFKYRYNMLCNIVKKIHLPFVKVAHQITITTSKDVIQAYYEDALVAGYEGLCFKDPEGTYKFGRSTHREQKFLRIKPEDTFDGKVIDIVERMENLVESVPNELGYMSKYQDKDQKAPTGMAAVAITECADFEEPVRVTLSRNLTDADRYEIWGNRESYIGNHLRFVGLPVAGMNQPRAPRFDAWRPDLD